MPSGAGSTRVSSPAPSPSPREVAGDAQGVNCPGGSCLLACSVFGRILGDSVVVYLLQLTSARAVKAGERLCTVAGHIIFGPKTGDERRKRGGSTLDDEFEQQARKGASETRQGKRRPSRRQ